MPEGVRGYGEDHKPLGRGDLDLGRFLDRLAEANYRGPLVFELRTEEALASLETIRAVRPAFLG
jgi:sugar phosphate isomerase/epimerase